MKFQNYNEFNRKKSTYFKFNKDIKFEQAGNKVDIRDWIDSSKDETDVYKNLERYGAIPQRITNKEALYIDLKGLNTTNDVLEKAKQAKNIWSKLDDNLKNKYGNNVSTFLRNANRLYNDLEGDLFKKATENQTKNENKGE